MVKLRDSAKVPEDMCRYHNASANCARLQPASWDELKVTASPNTALYLEARELIVAKFEKLSGQSSIFKPNRQDAIDAREQLFTQASSLLSTLISGRIMQLSELMRIGDASKVDALRQAGREAAEELRELGSISKRSFSGGGVKKRFSQMLENFDLVWRIISTSQSESGELQQSTLDALAGLGK